MVAPIFVEGYKTKKHPLYKIWVGMLSRCHCPTDKAFHNYGGRGIFVCDRWRYSFAAFVADMGPRPSNKHSIDRENNNGNYDPDNCRWATSKQQCNNARYNRFITANGKTLTMMQWSEETGLPFTTIKNRLNRGWEPIKAVTTPSQPKLKAGSIAPIGFTALCKQHGINQNTAEARLRHGWNLEDALNTPVASHCSVSVNSCESEHQQ